MIVEKEPSSPTLATRDLSPLPPINESKFETTDLTNKGQSENTLKEDITSLDNLNNLVSELGIEKHESALHKAEFYIGDDCMYSSPTAKRKEIEVLMNGQQNFVPKSPNNELETSGQKQNEASSQSPIPEFIPPDGGYGWVIAFSACIVNFFIVGFIKSYGVLYLDFMKKFPNASNYQASWLPVFLSTSGLLIAPITGILCRRFTSRKVSFVGGIFAFTGILLGAFANSMLQTIFTFGLLTGLGAGLTSTPGVLITSLYFENRQALASAICVSGNAIGGFVFPPLMEYLLSTYGLKGTLLIAAAMQLNICAASMMYRPIRLHALMQHRLNQKNKSDLKDQSKAALNPFQDNSSLRTFTKCESLLNRISSKKILSSSSLADEDEDELRHHVSFMRSASLLNSIPNLSEYARSWSCEQNSTLKPQPSIKFTHKCSKSSIATMVVNAKSQVELERQVSSGQQPRNNSSGMLVAEKNLSFKEKSSRSFCRSNDDDVTQPFLSRDFSKRMRIKPLSSVVEMETDSITSLSDVDISKICEKKKDIDEQNSSTNGQLNGGNLSVAKNIKNGKVETESQNVLIKEPKKQGMFDFSLFKTSTFWLVSASVMLMAAGAPHALFFLPAYAESSNIDKGTIIYLMSISSVVDLFGRLGIGFFSDLKLVRYSYLYALAAMTAGIALFVIPFLNSIAGIGVFLSMYGFGVGAWFVLIPPILATHHGSKKIASSYGLVRMFHGIMNIISPQVSGVLIDASGNYKSIYYFMGSSMALGGLLMFLEPFVVKVEKKKEKKAYIS